MRVTAIGCWGEDSDLLRLNVSANRFEAGPNPASRFFRARNLQNQPRIYADNTNLKTLLRMRLTLIRAYSRKSAAEIPSYRNSFSSADGP